MSHRSNIFESLLLYSVSCTNCEVFDKKKILGQLIVIPDTKVS